MFATPQNTRRPRPPGARRPSAQLRAAAAAAGSEFSAETLLNASANSVLSATPPGKGLKRSGSSAKKKGKAKALSPAPADAASSPRLDSANSSAENASFVSSPGLGRARPLSITSDSFTNAASPPPPYRYLGLSPELRDEKMDLPPLFPPPPPEPLESGPSSVRSSWVESDYNHDPTDDDATAGNTLTLEGLRRLLKEREREEEMAAEVSARMGPYETSHMSMTDSVRITRSNPASAVANASPPAFRLPPFQYRALRSDSSAPFSLAQPRYRTISSAKRDYERQLAYLHAEEEEERIAALEAALADARDSEEAQRKANARLIRDNSKLRRQLEHAEDAVAEHLEQEALRSSTSSRGSSPYTSFRGRSLRVSPGDAERVGWGAISFPEFPRNLDPDWRINLKESDESEDTATAATSSTNTRQASRETTPQLEGGEQLLPPLAIDQDKSTATTPPPESAEHSVILPSADRARMRPAVSSDTFISPDRSAGESALASSGPVTPRLTIEPGSNPSSVRVPDGGSRLRLSPYPSPRLPSPRLPSPRHQRSDSSGSNAGPHRRMPSFGSSNSASLHVPLSAREAATPRTVSPEEPAHVSPAAAIAYRMDSVRSCITDYLGRRTLGSELGSTYACSPSPLGTRTPASDTFSPESQAAGDESEGVEVSLDSIRPSFHSRLLQVCPPGNAKPRGTMPTATFVLCGSLSRAKTANAYEQLHEADAKHIRFADAKGRGQWSPESWPSPSPSPKQATLLPLLASDGESESFAKADRRSPTSGALVSFIGSTPFARMPGGAGRTPSPAPHLLAPGGDPWDEYSDRATPSPRSRALRPLLLGSKTSLQHRSNSLTYVHRRSASAASGVPSVRRFASGNGVAHPAIMMHRRNASLSTTALPRAPSGPVTIPGRIMHDIFCLFLIVLDYIEWAIILIYRLLIDIRAGPDAAISRRRTHAKRYYL